MPDCLEWHLQSVLHFVPKNTLSNETLNSHLSSRTNDGTFFLPKRFFNLKQHDPKTNAIFSTQNFARSASCCATCFASTAAVYSRLNVNCVMDTSSKRMLNPLARSVNIRRISRLTCYKPHPFNFQSLKFYFSHGQKLTGIVLSQHAFQSFLSNSTSQERNEIDLNDRRKHSFCVIRSQCPVNVLQLDGIRSRQNTQTDIHLSQNHPSDVQKDVRFANLCSQKCLK